MKPYDLPQLLLLIIAGCMLVFVPNDRRILLGSGVFFIWSLILAIQYYKQMKIWPDEQPRYKQFTISILIPVILGVIFLLNMFLSSRTPLPNWLRTWLPILLLFIQGAVSYKQRFIGEEKSNTTISKK